MADADEAKIAGSHVAELSGFFNAHDQWLFGHACVRTNGDRELAADLVQDTFEAAARAWPALREHDTGRQRAWLLATVANKNISAFRRTEAFRRRQLPTSTSAISPPPPTRQAQALNMIALKRAREIIEELPPRQRQIALMRWQDHRKTTEIAAELGLAEGTVHAHLHAARAKLTAGLAAVLPLRPRRHDDHDDTTAATGRRHDDNGRGAAS